MTVQIRKASRKKAKLRLGISAPSGCGKTVSSLLLAYGITKDWDKIGFIDTEEGSGELYVDQTFHGVKIGEYPYIRISENYDPVKYVDAIHALEKYGVEIIIIDSLTHAWSGKGGLLDKQNKIVQADSKSNSYTAWRTITPQHESLVFTMLQSPVHIIATMRSKVEYAMQTKASGKTEVVKMGLAPIQREGMEYEFTVFFDIDSNRNAKSTKDRTNLFAAINAAGEVENKTFVITPKTGEQLAVWLNTGVESIDSIAEYLATQINISEDLDKTFTDNQEQINRIKSERPEWEAMIMQLFENRVEELNIIKGE